METARISLRSGRRINVDCSIELSETERKTPIELTFKFDTGSQNTCIAAAEIQLVNSEEDFISKYKPRWKFEGSGIDDNSKISFYQIMVDNFFVQGITLGPVPIYITFDKRFSKRLLGLDLLNLLNIHMDNDERVLTISQTDRLKEYLRDGRSVTTEEMIKMGLYDPEFDLYYMSNN